MHIVTQLNVKKSIPSEEKKRYIHCLTGLSSYFVWQTSGNHMHLVVFVFYHSWQNDQLATENASSSKTNVQCACTRLFELNKFMFDIALFTGLIPSYLLLKTGH